MANIPDCPCWEYNESDDEYYFLGQHSSCYEWNKLINKFCPNCGEPAKKEAE